MSGLFSDVRVGAFAACLIQAHTDRAFATSSTGSARHKIERLLENELPDLLGDVTNTVDLDPWRVRQGALRGKKRPYLQIEHADKDGSKGNLLHGVYWPGSGILLTCIGLDIEADALPLTLYTGLQGKLEAMQGRGMFDAEDRPNLSRLIDLSIPGYDPRITGYRTETVLGSETISIKTDQATIAWPEFRKTMLEQIETRTGRDHD